MIVDWLGLKTPKKFHAWLGDPEQDLIIPGLPVPDDSVHAEAIEYVALAVAIERATTNGDRAQFTVMELGASYAPWATAGAVLAQRHGFANIHCIAVEASSSAISNIREHIELNGLLSHKNIDFEIVHAAVYVIDEMLYFPITNTAHDNGAQVVETQSGIDYRGLNLDYESVQGVTLSQLTAQIDRVDYLHMDLQGAEQKLLQDKSFVDCLNQKVATLFLATQSRLIEGLALEAFSSLGWKLIRERPTTYRQNDRTTDINGWTLRDGAQVWLNPKFGTAFTNH
ncbi:MAG: FkbM family methyltransferase [Methylococcaceae bacterium]